MTVLRSHGGAGEAGGAGGVAADRTKERGYPFCMRTLARWSCSTTRLLWEVVTPFALSWRHFTRPPLHMGGVVGAEVQIPVGACRLLVHPDVPTTMSLSGEQGI